MKIVFVLENYLPHIGGVETLFMQLAQGLVKKGHDVSIVTHRMNGTKKFEVLNGAKVYRIDCFQSRYIFTFAALPKVISLAKSADIIHTTTFNGAPPACWAAMLTKKPTIITVHEVWINKWRELTEMGTVSAFIHNFLETLVYSLNFNTYVCVSNYTKNALQNIKRNANIITIYNGMDYNHWNPKKYDNKRIRKELRLTNEFIILCYGRPGISKGFEYAIKSMPDIIKKIPNTKMILILSKDPAYKNQYQQLVQLIEKIDMQDRIIIHDPVAYKELPNYHMAADCVVIPSLSEGFGFTAAESCAMHVPVIATNNASLPEVISGEYVLVKPKDSQAIAEAVLKVHKKQATISKLKKFEWSTTVDNYIKEYEKLIRQHVHTRHK